MKSKLLLLILLLGATFTNGAYAQKLSARQVLDKTAAIVGRKVSGAKLAATSGTIAIKGNKFQATTPVAMVWFNGKTQWSYLKSTNEVNITTPTLAKQTTMNPLTFINMYKKGYTLSMKTIGNNYQVHLEAQQPDKQSIKELYIFINKNSYVPNQVKMKQASGWTTIKITNFQAKNQSDRIFTFNAKDFPSAEVIDMR